MDRNPLRIFRKRSKRRTIRETKTMHVEQCVFRLLDISTSSIVYHSPWAFSATVNTGISHNSFWRFAKFRNCWACQLIYKRFITCPGDIVRAKTMPFLLIYVRINSGSEFRWTCQDRLILEIRVKPRVDTTSKIVQRGHCLRTDDVKGLGLRPSRSKSQGQRSQNFVNSIPVPPLNVALLLRTKWSKDLSSGVFHPQASNRKICYARQQRGTGCLQVDGTSGDRSFRVSSQTFHEVSNTTSAGAVRLLYTSSWVWCFRRKRAIYENPMLCHAFLKL